MLIWICILFIFFGKVIKIYLRSYNMKERKIKYGLRKLSVGLVSCILGFSLVGGIGISHAEEVEVDPSYSIAWKNDNSPKKLDQYEEKLKDTKFKAKYTLEYEYVDKDGNKGTIRDKEFVENEFTVGTPQKFEADLEGVTERLKKENPNIEKVTGVFDLHLPLYGNDNNPYWGKAKGGSGLAKTNVVLEQNMNTHVKYEKDPNAIILEEDEGKINLEYRVNKVKDVEKTVLTSNDSKAISGKDKFEDGKEKYLAQTDRRIAYATENNSLGMFSEFTGKYETLEFEVSSLGIDDEESRKEEQNKYYNITIEGDDLEGWTVKLGSKLKDKTETKEREEKFTIKEIYDDSLDEGVRIVEKNGENGLVKDTIRTIFLKGENGKEETVKVDTTSEKIKEIVEQIVRIGTKRKTPDTPIIPGNPDTEIPEESPKLTKEEEDELQKLIEELLEEINKEDSTPDSKEDVEKPIEKEEDKAKEKEETKEIVKEEKKEKMANPTRKKAQMQNPVRTKADQKGSKNAKTGVTGSALVGAIGLSSIVARLGLRKKND